MTISHVTLEEIEPYPGGSSGGRQRGAADEDTVKPVVWFVGAKKGLIANKTNCLAVAAVHGDETDGWHGKQIIIYPTTIEAFGKSWPVIRVRPAIAPPAPRAASTPAQNSPPDTAATPGTQPTAIPDDEVLF